MTSEDIRAFFTRFLQVWERENLSAFVGCYADNARIDSPMFRTVTGRADIEKSLQGLFRAFDEWTFRIDDVIVDCGPEHRAVIFYTTQATHRGDLFGMPG